MSTISPNGGAPAIDAVDVRKAFDKAMAVDGISLTIQPGERVGIIGPNGAGKTTTLLMFLGAIEPDAGTIHLFNYSLPEQRHQAMTSVGFAAGYLPLPDRLKVDEALTFFAKLSDVIHVSDAVEQIMTELEITHLAKQQCMTLSSGQSTLVGMAKAMIHNPPLVILDEPTASLDPDVAFRVRDKLAKMNREHATTLLLTSHDMREVETLTDRVIFLRNGRIMADGPAAEIVAASGHSTLEEMFLAEAARLKGKLV